MSRVPGRLLTACLLAAATSAPVRGAEITAALKAAKGPGPAETGDYHNAELTLRNPGPGAVAAVRLRPAGGGLTVLADLAAPPGQESRATVPLPPLWPTETYEVTALDAAGAVVGRAAAEITWPPEAIRRGEFIDETFRSWGGEQGRWPQAFRAGLLGLGAIFVTAAAATLLIRRRVPRAAAAVALAGAAAGLIAGLFLPTQPAVEVRPHAVMMFDGLGGTEIDSFAVVSARRTGEIRYNARLLPHPVYGDQAAAVGDDSVLDVARSALQLTLAPGHVRAVRPAPRSPQPPAPAPRGRLLKAPGGFVVETAWLTPGRGLILRGDSVWPVPERAEGPAALRDDQARSLFAHLEGPGGAGWDTAARRLLMYWRGKHRRPGQTYLLMPSPSTPAAVRLEVLRLAEAAPETGPGDGG